MPAPDLSIIVPTLNEEGHLPGLLHDLSGLDIDRELIVVDGGSTDRTRELALDAGARVVEAEPGRGVQLRAGSALARASLLCFLHADSRLPTAAIRAIARLTREPPSYPVAFRLAIDAPGMAYRVIEAGTNTRSRLFSLPYGDQGLIVTHDLYWRAGGHPSVPLMEDVLLARALRRAGIPIRILEEAIRVSPRRWREHGPIRATVRNQLLLLRFFLGASPARLAKSYRAFRTGPSAARRMTERQQGERPAPPSGPALIVFARTPRAGEAKTRLSPPLSLAEAARVYEASLHDTVQLARRVPAELSIRFHDPSGEDAYFADTFPDIPRAPQCGGDLGARMAHAFDEGFLGGRDTVAIMGSDSPTVPLAYLGEGIIRLENSDVTLGPACDGGYYLVGIRRSAWPLAAQLFDGIEWSSDRVLADTLDSARSLGLGVSLLPEWYDIDSFADLERAREDAHGGRLAELLERLDFPAPSASPHRPEQGPR